MRNLALALAAQFADQSKEQRSDVLLEEALKEMGGEAWLR